MADEAVQGYYALASKYLDAARLAHAEGLIEPTIFNAIHALELSIKAALATLSDVEWKTHNVGGRFGRHFKAKVGRDISRQVNRILTKYNLPRYPSESPIDEKEAAGDFAFIDAFITKTVPELIAR